MRSSQKQLILLSLFAGSELAVYTFEALTSGVEVHNGPGGAGGGGGGGNGEGGGGGGEATYGGGGGTSAHRTADASFVAHRWPLAVLSMHMRIWPFHAPSSARWP